MVIIEGSDSANYRIIVMNVMNVQLVQKVHQMGYLDGKWNT